MNIAIRNDANISRGRNDKITNDANLAFELKQLWNLRSMKTIPMVIGVCGVIQEKLEKKICDFYSYYY